MRIESLQKLPAPLQEFYNVVKTLKAKGEKKEASKKGALASLIGYLDGAGKLAPLAGVTKEKSVLIVTQNGLALCDVNPQAHAEFDRSDSSPEIQAILEAEKGIKAAAAKLAAAFDAGREAGKVKYPKENSIRLEVLSPDKVEDMLVKYGPTIRAARRQKK